MRVVLARTGWLVAVLCAGCADGNRPPPRHYTADKPARAAPSTQPLRHPSHQHPHGPHPHVASDHHHHPHPHPHLAGENNHHHPY
jgi:hypothetical protein